MIFVFLFYFIKYTPITYGGDYHYPVWGEMLGFMISLSSMIWVPGKPFRNFEFSRANYLSASALPIWIFVAENLNDFYIVKNLNIRAKKTQ